MKFKGIATTVYSAMGVIGASISTMFGGWAAGLTFLVWSMAADYFTGFIVAYVFHKSPKTPSGKASSKIGFQGICKKGGILLVVFIAYQLETISGVSYIRDAAIIAYIVNELTSVIENLSIMGVPMPSVVTKAIELLKKEENFDVK